MQSPDSSGLRLVGRSARLSVLALMGGMGLLIAVPAVADISPALDRASISLGAFHADPTFNASANTRYGRLDSGDLESNSVTMPRLKADLVLFDGQGLSFDYYRYRTDYAKAFSRDFNANATSVTTSATGNLDLKLDFAKLAYKWWLGSGNTTLGLGAGAAYYRINLGGNAAATVNGAAGNFSDSYTNSAVAPLLEMGLRHAINPDLRLFADASGMRKNGGRLHGKIYNAALGLEWFPVKNIGLVLDYGVSHIDLVHDGSSNANLQVKLKGPSAFIKARF